MSLPDFKLLRPRTVDEAIGYLARHAPEVQVAAGGTDLIPSMRQGLFAPSYVIDLRSVAELRGIAELPEGGIAIGALTTLTAVEHSAAIRRDYPVLQQAAASVASPLLRNMGTIGGNICLDTRCLWYNQSLLWRTSCGFCIKKGEDVVPARATTALAGDPVTRGATDRDPGLLCHVAPGGSRCWAAFSGDTPPALLCLDAELEIASPIGLRRVPLREFYTNLGDSRMKLEKDELLTRVFLPTASAGWRGVYRKLRIRGSIDYPLAGVAVVLKLSNANVHVSFDAGRKTASTVEAARVALTAVNPAPLLVPGVAEALIGNAVDESAATAVGELAARTAKPLTTSALTPEYRREMVRVFTRRAVLEAAGGE